MTSSLTTALEKMNINNEQLKREVDVLKVDNTQLRANVDILKDEITELQDKQKDANLLVNWLLIMKINCNKYIFRAGKLIQ